MNTFFETDFKMIQTFPICPRLNVPKRKGNRSFRYEVVLIQTQAMKLHKNFDHSKYSLRMNQKNIFGEYSSFFKPSNCNYLKLDWINLYRNGLVPKGSAVTSVSTCCLANSSWKSYTLQPLNSVSLGKALHRRKSLPNKIHSLSTLNITQEECEKL